MARAVSALLFNLIYSLNKGEKKYFKQYVRSGHVKTDLNYLQLFDAIAKQKQYDETKILKLGIVKKAHLPMLKNYLYNLILESIRALRSKGSEIDSALKNMLDNARILWDKGLAEEEMKTLRKAKELALRHERWAAALEALLREIRIAKTGKDIKQQQVLEKEMDLLLRKLNNLLNYLKVNRTVLTQTYKLGTQRAAGNKMLEAAMKHPLLMEVSKGLSAESKKIFYDTYVRYYFFIRNYQNAEKMMLQLTHLIESNYTSFEFSEFDYSSALNGLAIVQNELGNHAEALSTIEKHRTLVCKSAPAKLHALIYSSINTTNYYLFTKEFEKGIAAIQGDDVEKKLNQQSDISTWGMSNTALFTLYYNIALLYFGAGDYHQSLRYINKVANYPKVWFREDMQAGFRILQILIHYELNTPDILEHIRVSTYRFLRKKKLLYKAEDALLGFIGRLIKTGLYSERRDASQKAWVEKFRKFRDELIQITKNPNEKAALIDVDLISWLESKMEGKSYAEVLKAHLPTAKSDTNTRK